jgi:dienelactone hydrolase
VKLSRVLWLLPLALATAQTAPDAAAIARKALDLFLGQKFTEMNAMMAPAIKDSYKPEALSKFAATYKAWGDVEKIGEPSVQDMGPVKMVVIPVQFAKQAINFQFAINAEGQVAQWLARPGGVAWSRPDYVKPDAFKTREITIGADNWKLPGTLTIPNGQGPFPAVVLVPDSGPSDRDATVGAVKVFRDLAEGLASRGIVALRYEKRTRQYAAQMTGTSYTIGDETTDDAANAIAALRTQPEVDGRRIFVLGFGVGGYVAPRIAAEDGKVAGLILLGANEHPLEDLILEDAIELGVAGKQLDALKQQVAKVKSLEEADTSLPPQLGEPVAYWLDLKGYDPAAELKKLGIPVLILQGGRDFQVTSSEFDAWKAALNGKKDATLKSYPAMNHLFVAGEGKSTEQEYRKPGHVGAEVIADIATFIKP